MIKILRYSLLSFLNTFVLLGHAHIIMPELHFTYDWRGKLIDTLGYNLKYIGITGFSKVDQRLIDVFEIEFPRFQKQWLGTGTILFKEVYALFKKGFKQSARTAIISLGSNGGYGSRNILFLGINTFFDTSKWDLNITPQETFVDLVFHELLHIWLDDNCNFEKSYFLKKYNNESQNVREHIHLMAIQKMIYISLNRQDILEMLNSSYSIFPEYQRAWQIVNEIEDYSDIIDDVQLCLDI